MSPFLDVALDAITFNDMSYVMTSKAVQTTVNVRPKLVSFLK